MISLERKKKFLIDVSFLSVVAVLLFLILKFCTAYFLPFVIGIVLASIVQKPAARISRATKLKKGYISVFFVVILYLLTLSVLSLIGMLIYGRLSVFVETLPLYMDHYKVIFDEVSSTLTKLLNRLPPEVLSAVETLPETVISKFTSAATSFLSASVAGIATNIPSILITIIVTVVASCYLAKDSDVVMSFIRTHISVKVHKIIVDAKDIFFKSVLRIVKSYLLLMLLTFFELSIGFLILGVDNAIALAAIIAVVDVLPVLGTGAILIPWGIIGLLSGDFLIGFGMLILYLAIVLVRNFFEPKIIGDQVGLHPLATLASMFVGLRFAGVFGMLGFPIAIIIISGLQKRGTISLFGKKKQTE